MYATHKTCSKCKQVLPVDRFYKCTRAKSPDGFQYYCKDCTAVNKKHNLQDPTKRAHYDARIKNWAYKKRRINQAQYLLYKAKDRARRAGLDFDLTVEDVVIPERCPVLGLELTVAQKAGGASNSASIDRIDNTQGYIKGNIKVISLRANQIKRDATVEEIEAILAYMTQK